MGTLFRLALLAAVLLTQSAAAATHPVLTLGDARKVMSAALTYAHAHGAPGAAVAIVDEGGSVVLLERLNDTFPAAPNISIGKARTAAGFLKPTRELEKIVNGGRVTMTALPGVTTFTPLQGGVPLSVGAAFIGAIGVSGSATAQQDDEIAQAGADALGATSTASNESARYSSANDVKKAFDRGDSLLSTSEYTVVASRRDAPGQVEVHSLDTDIFYVLEGSATLVTGGTVVDPKNTAAGETRGSRIEGGSERHLSKGDVVVIGRGVPHWFRSVQGPLEYFTVKSTAQSE
jgi:glc operon protein GlcG